MNHRAKMKAARILCMALLILILAGCAAQPHEPSPTIVPLPPVVQPTSDAQMQATLYFRYLDEGYLIPQTRVIAPAKGESYETALVKELLKGPSTDQPDARALLEDVEVLSVETSPNYVEVTLSRRFIEQPRGAPSEWWLEPKWVDTIQTSRWLGIYSIVNTLTEDRDIQSVLFYIGNSTEHTRLTRRDIELPGVPNPNSTGVRSPDMEPMEPIERQATKILTAERVAQLAMDAISLQDAARLTRLLDGGVEEAAVQALLAGGMLEEYTLNPFTLVVSEDGAAASISIAYVYVKADRTTVSKQNVYLALKRVSGVWKVDWTGIREMLL